MKNTLLLIIIVILFFELSAKAQTQQIHVGFSANTVGYGNIKGEFQNIKSTVLFDANNLEHTHFLIQIQTSSLETKRRLVNRFMKSKSFFSTDEFPEVTFQSVSFSKKGNQFEVTGFLRIKGISKKIVIPFEMNEDEQNYRLNGTLTVNRFDYNLGKKYGSFLVRKKVNVELNCVFPKEIKGISNLFVVK